MHSLLFSFAFSLASVLDTCIATSPSFALAQPQAALSEDPYSPFYPTTLLGLHRELVKRESITGNEHAVGEYLISYLEAFNLTAKKQHVSHHKSIKEKPRFNILAYKGHNPHTRALLSSHIDTVPPYWPYEMRNSHTEIWGRGSVDAKGSVAAQIFAFWELLADKKIDKSDLGLLFVVGEETGGDGMKTVNDLELAPEAVIFGEPTEAKLVAGHKGILSFNIVVTGAAAHSGYPWLGQSANELLVVALTALLDVAAKNGTENGGLPWSAKYGASTLNIGKMAGGVASNVVAENAEAAVSIRLAGGTPEEVERIVSAAVKQATEPLVRRNGKGKVEVEFAEGAYGPVDIDADIDGFEVITVNYGTDIPNLKGDHKRYLYGPGSILVAHSDHEHLKVADLYEAVKGYKKIALDLLSR